MRAYERLYIHGGIFCEQIVIFKIVNQPIWKLYMCEYIGGSLYWHRLSQSSSTSQVLILAAILDLV